MKMIVLAAARLDEREAATWYKAESPELARRFRKELQTVLRRVVSAPQHFPKVASGARRALLSVFPYAVVFAESQTTIILLAIAHTSRDPDFWAGRLQTPSSDLP